MRLLSGTVVRYTWAGIILVVALLLKYHYSTAGAHELQWMLWPLAWLTQTLSGLDFIRADTGDWINLDNNVAIVKSCAGVNFMILSLLVYARRMQPRVSAAGTTGRLLPLTAGCVILCLAAAWGAALLVNTLRIIAAIYLYQQEIAFANFSMEQIHRVAGVLIYFPALWLQFYLFSGGRRERAGIAAAISYLGLMIVVPLLTGGYRINPELFIEHVMVTGGLTIVFLVILAYKGSDMHGQSL